MFVRLTGCPLRRQYCDTAYAFSGGDWWSLHDTGRNPQARHAVRLRDGRLTALRCSRNFAIRFQRSLERRCVRHRAGRHPREPSGGREEPGSGEQQRNRWENLPLLTPHDALKFVICDARTRWSRTVLTDRTVTRRARVLSPSSSKFPRERSPTGFSRTFARAAAGAGCAVLWGDVPGR